MYVTEKCAPILQLHAAAQTPQHSLVDPPPNPHHVLAIDACARMHQAFGQFPIIAEQKQAGGIDVQASHCDPASRMQFRQAVENGRPALRVTAGANFSGQFVIKQNTREGGGSAPHPTGAHPDFFASRDALSQYGAPAIDPHFAGSDPLLGFAPGTKPAGSEHFL